MARAVRKAHFDPSQTEAVAAKEPKVSLFTSLAICCEILATVFFGFTGVSFEEDIEAPCRFRCGLGNLQRVFI